MWSRTIDAALRRSRPSLSCSVATSAKACASAPLKPCLASCAASDFWCATRASNSRICLFAISRDKSCITATFHKTGTAQSLIAIPYASKICALHKCFVATQHARDPQCVCPPHGTFQISSAYSAIARSEENQPIAAILQMLIRIHSLRDDQTLSIRLWVSK